MKSVFVVESRGPEVRTGQDPEPCGGAENVEAWRHLQRFPARMDSRPRPSRRHTDLAAFGRNGIQPKIKANNVWRWGTLLGELLSDTRGILLSPFGPFLYIWSWLSTSVPCTQSGIKPSRVWTFSLIEMLRHYCLFSQGTWTLQVLHQKRRVGRTACVCVSWLSMSVHVCIFACEKKEDMKDRDDLMCRRVYSFHIKCSYDFLL